jgi:DNA-binding SARP family transcriptional activator
MTSRLRLTVMGPLRVWRDDTELDAGPRQQRCLLALLLVREGRPVSINDLVNLLWGTEPPPSAVNNIHKYVGSLRRLLEPGLPPRSAGAYLQRHRIGYRFVAGPATLDLALFRRLVAAARTGAAGNGPVEALDRYAEALRLVHGPTGDALSDSPAATATFAAIDNEFVAAATDAAEIAVLVRRPMEVLPSLRLAAEMDRLNEPIHAALVTTLAAAGYQAESLAVHRGICTRLADELGIDPGRELREAQQRVLTQAAAPLPTTRPTPAALPLAQLPPSSPRIADRPVGSLAQFVSSTPLDADRPVGPLAQLQPSAPLSADGPARSLSQLSPASLHENDRPSQLLTVGPVIPLAQLPPDQPLFTGRKTELDRLAELAGDLDDGGPTVIAVHGEAGVGKSTLVTHFARRTAGDFPDGQLHLDLRCGVTEGLRAFLYALGIRKTDIPTTLEAMTGAYRSLTASSRLLVVLDNVHDATPAHALVPSAPGSLVLTTSREPLVDLAASAGASLVHLDRPDLPEARDLFRARLPAHIHADDDALDRVVELQGRLPMALAALAARLCASSGVG